MRTNLSKLMELKLLINNIFISNPQLISDDLLAVLPRFGLSYVLFCNASGLGLDINADMTELSGSQLFYRLRASNIFNYNDLLPDVNMPQLNSTNLLTTNLIRIKVDSRHISPVLLDIVEDKYVVNSDYLLQNQNFYMYDKEHQYETSNIYINSAFITNYREEVIDGVVKKFDFYDREITDSRDLIIFAGFNFMSNNRPLVIDLLRGFNSLDWVLII